MAMERVTAWRGTYFNERIRYSGGGSTPFVGRLAGLFEVGEERCQRGGGLVMVGE